MPEPLVRFLGVSKSFGRAEVLGDRSRCSLGRVRGAWPGLNGAGKTTLIKCLLDFCDSIRARSRSTAPRSHRGPAPALRSWSGLPPLFSHRSRIHSDDAATVRMPIREQRVVPMFAALDLDVAALDKPVRAYSKGMTQKLGLPPAFFRNAICTFSTNDERPRSQGGAPAPRTCS